MNELYFFFHILVIVTFTLGALKLGKEALIASFAIQALLGNLFVTKQMLCFGLNVTCSDVYTIGALFSLNLIQEYFGKNLAKKTIWISSFILFFFIILSQIHLSYLPSPHDTMQKSFFAVLAFAPRIMLVSFFVAFACQKLDVEIYSFFKKRRILLRFGSSSLISQFIDTILFSFLALYGLVHSLFDIIFMSYLIKVIVIFCMAPFTVFAKKIFKTRRANELI